MVANRSQEPLVVEPGHPVESGELDIIDSLPRAVLSNDLGLVQADHRFGQRVVIGIAPASNRRFDPGFGEPLRVADRQILGEFKSVVATSRK